jgi:hypothetical protein
MAWMGSAAGSQILELSLQAHSIHIDATKTWTITKTLEEQHRVRNKSHRRQTTKIAMGV